VSAPVAILISALGGEGGGVLAGWITNAAAATGLAVQRTSVPGVAQRTGATTYYLEIYPDELRPDQRPDLVLSLTPMPGAVDVVLATELLETARTMQAGFVTPDRTTLIASTHRIYTIAERGASGDGRIDPDGVFAAAGALARTCTMFDMQATAKTNDSHTNAVILGALAASGRLPLGRAAFEGAIQTSGIAVDANLRGFAAGFEAAQVPPAAARQTSGEDRAPASAGADLGELAAFLPGDVASLACEAVHRLRGYQDARYAELFLYRLRPVAELDEAAYALTKIVVRHLATMMAYEDVMRVAQLKSTRERLDRVRREAGSAPGDVVRIAEYLKPGPDEFAAILPPTLALRLLR
jgi:indolepyruvate ferredoxin oxidoreductase beta subunit